MQAFTTIGTLALLVSFTLGNVKGDECPPGPIPGGCPLPDKELSTFFTHPNDCHWFYHCSNGVPYCKECPDVLYWNEVLQTCDYPVNVQCNAGGEPSTTQRPTRPPTTTTVRPTRPPSTTTVRPTRPPTAQPTTTEEAVVCPPGAVPVCPNPDPAFSVFFPHENDCNWFFHCSNGVAYCKQCPDGLHWNTQLDTCDWPNRPTRPPTTTRTTTVRPTRPPTTTTVRPTRPPTTTTVRSTRPPTTTTTTVRSTRPPTTTTVRPTTTKPPTTTEEAAVCPPGAIPVCPNPDPAFSVFFPHENDCNWFFHCSNGIAYCKQCPAGLHWNTELDTCDWPDNAGCISRPTTAKPTRPTRPPTTTRATTIRPTRPPTTTTLRPTRPPTTTRTTVRSTRPPTTTTVRPTRPPTEKPITTEETVVCPQGAIPVCPNPDPAFSVFFPHENDCHWFYHCSNGIAYCKICPAGLHWNPDLDTCDYSYRAGCV